MKTGTVVTHERPDHYSKDHITAVVLRGLIGVREGQQLKCDEEIWIVEKRYWVSKTHVSLYLYSKSGKLPEIGKTLELILTGKRLPILEVKPEVKPVKKEKKPKKVKPPIEEDIPVDEETR